MAVVAVVAIVVVVMSERAVTQICRAARLRTSDPRPPPRPIFFYLLCSCLLTSLTFSPHFHTSHKYPLPPRSSRPSVPRRTYTHNAISLSFSPLALARASPSPLSGSCVSHTYFSGSCMFCCFSLVHSHYPFSPSLSSRSAPSVCLGSLLCVCRTLTKLLVFVLCNLITHCAWSYAAKCYLSLLCLTVVHAKIIRSVLPCRLDEQKKVQKQKDRSWSCILLIQWNSGTAGYLNY